MAIRDLVPVRRASRSRLPIRRRRDEEQEELSPFLALQRDMTRLFDEMFDSFFGSDRPMLAHRRDLTSEFLPSVDVREKSKEIVVTAELPGVDEDDVEVRIDDDTLIIRGEKREEHEAEEGGWYHSERVYGSFVRTVPLPAEVDADRAEARFRKGVLKITLPKLNPVESGGKRIEVRKG